MKQINLKTIKSTFRKIISKTMNYSGEDNIIIDEAAMDDADVEIPITSTLADEAEETGA